MIAGTGKLTGTGKEVMGADDKLEAKGDQLKGKVKEGVGDVTGDDKLEAEGQGDQVKGHVKEAAEKVKDIFKK
ncbi:uncharacterized protein YjbJ (UPF0337 family) [Crossiella equi]|uniref:Uncharacterized protein YjbJ (UPF0337 family) n=1 Tax=Crossiella equi TaxID=130796 RepID=A0ABS5A772_9PSEU|nr:CsbD family protein [Crossiella equi]MBP2472161.1 uncharacterized protein YjbJ (UPF0337 family) [Crossiella equi]